MSIALHDISLDNLWRADIECIIELLFTFMEGLHENTKFPYALVLYLGDIDDHVGLKKDCSGMVTHAVRCRGPDPACRTCACALAAWRSPELNTWQSGLTHLHRVMLHHRPS